MPTYEYVCSKCEHHFEVTQRITAEALTVCLKEFCPRKPWGKGKVKRTVGGKVLWVALQRERVLHNRLQKLKDTRLPRKRMLKREFQRVREEGKTKSSDSGGSRKPAASPPPASSGPKKRLNLTEKNREKRSFSGRIGPFSVSRGRD